MTESTVHRPDLIIRNARIVDGTGGPSRSGDIAIADDRIVSVGDAVARSGESAGAIEIDALGRVVAPGFIDTHTHDDRALLADPLLHCKVSQGVTTVVTGNCGLSLAPLSVAHRPPAPVDLIADEPQFFFREFSEYLQALHEDPPSVNAACQVGHSTLRVGAMESLDRAASSAEIKSMRERLERSLEAGALGMSTGLYYPPASKAPTEEIVELARALEPYGAIHTTHMRDESDRIVDSLEESFRIGREAGVPLVISHHKCVGKQNHGRTPETLAIIDGARNTQAVGLDAYPYIASSTMLDASRLSGASRVLVTWSEPYPDAAGRDLEEVAAELGVAPEAAVDMLRPAGAIYFMMDEDDVRRVLAYPHTMIGSDGLPHDVHPHPRLWGTFPRVLGHYARDTALFSLEEAVRKMTSLPAAQFGFADRGVLRPGAYADLALFDPDTVIDKATFEHPMRAAEGIDMVMVNGRVVLQNGVRTDARPGRVLRRESRA